MSKLTNYNGRYCESEFEEKYQKAAGCLEEGFEDSIQYYEFSKIDSRKISSTNKLERLNKKAEDADRMLAFSRV